MSFKYQNIIKIYFKPFPYHLQEIQTKKKNSNCFKTHIKCFKLWMHIWKCLRVLWSFCVQKTIHMVNQILYTHLYVRFQAKCLLRKSSFNVIQVQNKIWYIQILDNPPSLIPFYTEKPLYYRNCFVGFEYKVKQYSIQPPSFQTLFFSLTYI